LGGVGDWTVSEDGPTEGRLLHKIKPRSFCPPGGRREEGNGFWNVKGGGRCRRGKWLRPFPPSVVVVNFCFPDCSLLFLFPPQGIGGRVCRVATPRASSLRLLWLGRAVGGHRAGDGGGRFFLPLLPPSSSSLPARSLATGELLRGTFGS